MRRRAIINATGSGRSSYAGMSKGTGTAIMSPGKRTTQTSKREAGYLRMRAEQPDRDGQYHGLHRSYAGNRDTLGGKDATDRSEDRRDHRTK